MKTFVGLDVSQKKTSICVVDHNGNKIRMANVDTHLLEGIDWRQPKRLLSSLTLL